MANNNRIRTAVTTGMMLALLALGANALRLGVERVTAQPAPLLPAGAVVAPYTVVLSETVVSASSKRRLGPSQTISMRSDGATVLKIAEGEGETRLIRLPDGTRAEVNDSLRAVSSVRKPYDRAWLRDPLRGCASPIVDNPLEAQEARPVVEVLQGHRSARIVHGNVTSWYALDVGCALLKKVIAFKEGGSSNLALVSLIPGEPSPALFRVPGDYAEGPPSALAGPAGDCDAACADSRRRWFERLDEQYDRYRIR